MKRALVVTVGSRHESLGALKLAKYLLRNGFSVEETNAVSMFDTGYDLVAFSIVFSWKIPTLIEMVNEAKRTAKEIWIGGPAVTFSGKNFEHIFNKTGIVPKTGIDERFEREKGKFPMVYFSRGCPAYTPACGLCPVPRIEGNAFRFYPESEPAALLLDNNLSALPVDYQEYIINRYKDFPSLVDANSGFEPHTFTEETLSRWKRFPLRCWRFGYDDISEREQSLEMMRVLLKHGYSGEKVRVYTLIGNEPKKVCHQRMKEVIANGCHPWPQRVRPLDWLGGALPVQHDWDEPTLIAFQRFYSIAGLWKRIKPDEFYYQKRYPLRED